MPPVNILSEDSDSGEDLNKITIDEHYAKAFAYRKERQELERLKEKYGSDAEEGDEEEEDSEELESEDEDGEELTPGVDAAILRMLAKIKRKDPEIYNTDKAIFEEEQQKSGRLASKPKTRKDKSKPITIRQEKLAAELAFASRSPSPDPGALKPLTHTQEQKKLRDETIAAFHTAVSGDAPDEDDLLVPREKTKDELEHEEEEYQEFLRREVGGDLTELIAVDEDTIGIREVPGSEDDDNGTKKKKKEKGKKIKGQPTTKEQKEKEDQEFLMNYVLNRGWIDRSAKRLPTYAEVTGVGNRKKKSEPNGPKEEEDEATGPSGGFSESEVGDGTGDGLDVGGEDEFDDVADAFESSYNFRFEEPNAGEITRHPRNITSAVRRQDTKRKEARERRKARKEEELLQRREEVKRLKALKMKELQRKLERIGKEGGLRGIDKHPALQDLDLEGDWDPDAHDRQMAGIYAQDDDREFYDEEKPTWDDDINIDDITPPVASSSKQKGRKKGKKTGDEGHGAGEDDEAYEEDWEWDDEWDGTEEMRKKKLQEYLDSLSGLDFNDMVAGIPTRFKYITTAPQSFGLTAAEILMADDKDLNQYMGVKKYAPYRKGGKWDKQRPERLRELRNKLKARLANGDGEDGEVRVKKRKGKKERQRTRAVATGGTVPEPDDTQTDSNEKKRKLEDTPGTVEASSSKKRKRRHGKSSLATSAE